LLPIADYLPGSHPQLALFICCREAFHLRYADELRDPKSYFEGITNEPDPKAVKLAAELIERKSGRFEPEKMPDQYAAAGERARE
jgi:non-homologous end joining protein Ku